MSFFRHVVCRSLERARPLRRRTLLAAGFLSLLAGGASAQSSPTPETWCSHAMAGPASVLPAPVALSAAHAQVRFFGTGPSYAHADVNLTAALEGAAVDWDSAARAYAAALDSVCALDVSAASLPAARVLSVGPIALVRPGTGPLVLPRQTRAVLIDLRGLPAVPGLDEALARAIGVASTVPVERLSERVRLNEGMMDELDPNNLYGSYPELRAPPSHAATGQAELPVALLTRAALAPAAARFAVDLRMAGRAWLVGAPVHTAVAESRWMPVDASGLLVRTLRLEDAQGAVPDVIPADLPVPLLDADPDGSAAAAAWSRMLPPASFFLALPGPVDRTAPVLRQTPVPRVPLEAIPPIGASSGIARADLLILHGATRLFFPYFHVVGDGIDSRLLETLATVDAAPVTDREQLNRLLLRFNEVLHDGHGFVSTLAAPPPAGYFPVVLEEVQGAPVIRRSALPDVLPGDTVVSVGGRPMSEWLAEEQAHASAATPGYLHDVAARRLQVMSGPTVFGLRGVDGTTREVEVQPQPQAVLNQVSGPASLRPAGSLADLGAPELHYLNLAGEVLGTVGAFRTALAAAQGASGLVVDMRGYPAVNHYEVAQRLIPQAFRSPVFRLPTWTGSDTFEMGEFFSTRQPLSNPSYAGPIVLLVGPRTVSAAENFSMMLRDAHRVTVIGRRSAGTNGNITNVLLPGLMSASFTGMEVLFQDRSRFHGVGIVPHIEVAPTVEDVAEGRDPELLRAIQFLRTGA